MAIKGSAGQRSKDAIYGKEATDNGSYSASETARTYTIGNEDPNSNSNWGKGASRSLYSVFSNGGGNEARNRDLLKSRLWKGVPQLSIDQLKAFEAAMAEGNLEVAAEKLRLAEKKLMQAAAKGTISKHAASRKVSRLTKRFNAAKAAK